MTDKEEILEFAKVCINKRSSTSDRVEGLWFRKMEPEGQYIAGNKRIVYSIIHMSNRFYMNKIL